MQGLADLLPNGPVLTIEDGKVIYNGRSTLLEDAATTLLHDLEKAPLGFLLLENRSFSSMVLSFAHLHQPFAQSLLATVFALLSADIVDSMVTTTSLSHEQATAITINTISCLCCTIAHHFDLSETALDLLRALDRFDGHLSYPPNLVASLFRMGMADACRSGMKHQDKFIRQTGGDLVVEALHTSLQRSTSNEYVAQLYHLLAEATLSTITREASPYLSPSRGSYVCDCLIVLPVAEFNALLQAIIDIVGSQQNELLEGGLASLLEALDRQEASYFNSTTEAVLSELTFHASYKVRAGALRGLFFSPVALLVMSAERVCDVSNGVRSAACECMTLGALKIITDDTAEHSTLAVSALQSSGHKKVRTPHNWYVKAARTLACMLMDNTTLVRKAACKGLVSLLQHNPWGPSINSHELKILYNIVCKKYDKHLSFSYEDKIDLAVSLAISVLNESENTEVTDRNNARKQVDIVVSALRFAQIYEECLRLIRSHLVSTQLSDSEVFILIETCLEFKVYGSLEACCDLIALASASGTSTEALDSRVLTSVFRVLFENGIYKSEDIEGNTTKPLEGSDQSFVNEFVNRIIFFYSTIANTYPAEAHLRHDQLDRTITVLLAAIAKNTAKLTVPSALQDLLDFSRVTITRRNMIEKLLTGVLSEVDIVKYVSVRLLNMFTSIYNRFLVISSETVIRVMTIFVGALLSSKNTLFLKEMGILCYTLLSAAFSGNILEPILVTVQSHGENMKNSFLHLLQSVHNYIGNNPFLCFSEFVGILGLGGKVYIDNLSGMLMATNTVAHLIGYTSLYAELSGLLFNEYIHMLGNETAKNTLLNSGSIFMTGPNVPHSCDDIMEEFSELYVAADVALNALSTMCDSYDTGEIEVASGAVFYSLILNIGKFCATLPLNFKIKDPKTGNRRYFIEAALLLFVKAMKLPREHTNQSNPAQFAAYKSLISCVMTNSSVFTTKFALEQLFYPLLQNDWPEFQATGLLHLTQLISADYLKPETHILCALKLLSNDNDNVSSIAGILFDTIAKKQPNPLRSHISELISSLLTSMESATEEEYEFMIKYLIDMAVDANIVIALTKNIVHLADKYHTNELVIKRILYCVTYLHSKVISKASPNIVAEFRSVASQLMEWAGPNSQISSLLPDDVSTLSCVKASRRMPSRRTTGKTSRRSTKGLLNLSDLESDDSIEDGW